MTEKPSNKTPFSADWLLRGALTKIGDTVDRFTGRRWIPSSSLATSELIERIKKLMDAEKRSVPGKGVVVPHNLKLKVQWNKFSTEGEDTVKRLEDELLVATVDHINDSLYYTFAPLSITVEPDYFIEGVKLTAGFDKFGDESPEVEMNVTVAGMNLAAELSKAETVKLPARTTYNANFELNGIKKTKLLEFESGKSISVGRSGSNSLVIDDNSISKIHASLSVDGEGRLSVADTGSTNGTFLNDERIAYGKAIRLEDSDRMKFGTVEVRFERVSQADEEPASDAVNSDTVEIDGFEFTSRASTEINLPSVEREPATTETGSSDSANSEDENPAE